MKQSTLIFSLFFLVLSNLVGQIPTTIFFSYDSDIPPNDTKNIIAQIPKEHLQKIILIGHCDSSGSYNYNYELSMRRAENTRKELTKAGFSPSQWQIVGKSFSSPSNANLKAKNRRVEIIPIYNDNNIHQLSLFHQTSQNSYTISCQKKHFAQVGVHDSLPKLKTKHTYRLDNLYFVPNKATVLEESHPAMMALFLTMQSNPSLKIKIEGHTNGVHTKKTEDWHLKTSAARAKTTQDYLVSLGISPTRITTVGYGHKYMLFPNSKNKEELKQNRRVEIKVMSL